MIEEKAYITKKLVEFQKQNIELKKQNKELIYNSEEKQNKLFLQLIDIIDAIESIEASYEEKKDALPDKTSKMLLKNIASIKKKLERILRKDNIVKLEIPDNKAAMGLCKIIDTEEHPDMEDTYILKTVKSGYINRKTKKMLRKAEVITVLNKKSSHS